MSPELEIGALIFSMLFSAGGVVFATGRIVQRLKSHEDLDQARFDTQQAMWQEVREDIREIRNQGREH